MRKRRSREENDRDNRIIFSDIAADFGAAQDRQSEFQNNGGKLADTRQFQPLLTAVCENNSVTLRFENKLYQFTIVVISVNTENISFGLYLQPPCI